MLGSWNFALNYYLGQWKFRAYLEHYFEDTSQMFWEYGRWKDGQIGLEITFPKNRWITSAVWEGLSTKNKLVLYYMTVFGDSFLNIKSAPMIIITTITSMVDGNIKEWVWAIHFYLAPPIMKTTAFHLKVTA